MNKIVSNLRAKTGPQHLFEYNLQTVVKTNNNKKKHMYFKMMFLRIHYQFYAFWR